MSTHRTLAIAGLASAITAVTVGGTAVAIVASGTQVKTCVHKSTGLVRVAKTCKKTERVLLLGQVGPTGATGASGTNGATGLTGATGATGTSDVYSSNSATSGFINAGITGALVTVSLPAGTFSVAGMITADVAGGTDNDFYCWLSSGTSHTPYVETAFTSSGPRTYGSVSPIGTVVLTSPGTVTLNCFSSNSTGSGATRDQVDGGAITAVQVGTLHATTTGAGFH